MALLIGYARCSTDRQDLTAQRDALAALGLAPARVYVDNGLTGTNRGPCGMTWVARQTRASNKRKGELQMSIPLDEGPFFHGTAADLSVGEFLTAGRRSNYRPEIVMNHVYFTARLDGAGLAAEIAAELADGEAIPRVYEVEPTGAFDNDPNVTGKKFPGNPTRSYRSSDPLRVVREITGWTRLTTEQLQIWQGRLSVLRAAAASPVAVRCCCR